jgi:hypothetical protein
MSVVGQDMRSMELLRYNNALEVNTDAVSKNASWYDGVCNDASFDHMKDETKLIYSYEKSLLEISNTKIHMEHCRNMISIRDRNTV